MSKGNYLIAYKKGLLTYKLCRIFFGNDGSYYVTSPYHKLGRARFAKMTIRYGHHGEDIVIPKENTLDSGFADNDQHLKLSHHPDGFIQFSGKGIVSGKDSEGNPKGMAIQSWPLSHPCLGPAFGMTLLGLESFEVATNTKDSDCIFEHEQLAPDYEANGFILECFYFSPNMRNFIRVSKCGELSFQYFHPSHAIIDLKVLTPRKNCKIQGFIGVRLYPKKVLIENVDSAFWLGSSTSDLRLDSDGHKIGEVLYCFYPRMPGMSEERDLNFRQTNSDEQAFYT